MPGRSVGDGLAELAGAVVDVRDELQRRRRLEERRDALDLEERVRSDARLRPVSAVLWASYAQPGMLGAMFQKIVPDSYVEAREGSGVVACPCGERVEVPDVEMRECECGRWFLWHRGLMRVWRAPSAPAGSEGPDVAEGSSQAQAA